MAIVAGVVLAVLVVGPLVLAFTPSRQRDPQEGMAIGCLMMFSSAMLIPSGLLAWGHFGVHPTLVKVIFWVLTAIVAYVAVAGTAMTIIRYRKQRR